jgi:HlyD family secretion protein
MKSRRAGALVRSIVTIAIAVVGVAAVSVLIYRWVRPEVTVTDAVEGPVVQAFYSTGTIQPDREFPIKSNVAGTITKMLVDKGDAVKAGQVLAFVSDPERELTLKKARAELAEKRQLADESTSPVLQEFDAKIEAIKDLLAIAEREQARVQAMLERSAGSQTDLDRAMDRVKTLWSEQQALIAQRATRRIQLLKDVEVASAAEAIAQWNVDQQTIKSPIDGVVLDRPVSLGTRLAVNDHIMQIADVRPENLVMRAAVDEEDIDKVHDAQFVRMTLYSFPGQVFNGRVEQIYDKADPERRTFEVDVKIEDRTDRLAAGMTGELAFVMAEKDRAQVVPAQAVQNGAIWVVRKGKLHRSEVRIGLRSVERVELLDPLPPGDRVVISPIGDLQEGQSVRTAYMDPQTAAGLNKPREVEGNFKGFN